MNRVYSRAVAYIALVLLIACAPMNNIAASDKGKKMLVQTTAELFSLIQMVGQSFPLNPEKLASVIQTELKLANENDFVKFFEAGPINLSNGVVVQKLDYRAHKIDPKHQGFVVLNLQGTCTTLAEIRQHYNQLEVTQIPKGRSELDTTTYSTMTPWGKLNFSFMEKSPDCLSSVSFDPQATGLHE